MTSAVVFAFLLLTPARALQPETPHVTVMKQNAPAKTLRVEVVVPAPVSDVWSAFTTSEGLSTWLWSEARVELKPGGDWLALYPEGKTGGGTIVSFVPMREIMIRALAPEAFPAVREHRTDVRFQFEPVAATSTRVTLVQTGWQDGPEWDSAYDYLSKGNAILFEQLYKRFTSGPIQWKK